MVIEPLVMGGDPQGPQHPQGVPRVVQDGVQSTGSQMIEGSNKVSWSDPVHPERSSTQTRCWVQLQSFASQS